MGQSQLPAAKVADTIITNALIVDAKLGILKADIGLKTGASGRSGKAATRMYSPTSRCRLVRQLR